MESGFYPFGSPLEADELGKNLFHYLYRRKWTTREVCSLADKVKGVHFCALIDKDPIQLSRERGRISRVP